MGNQSSARIKGDHYQHLLSWYYILFLKRPKSGAIKINLEDDEAGFVDDLTIYKEKDGQKTVEFHQIKYHVDKREAYSINSLLTSSSASKKSLMDKFWNTWKNISKNYSKGDITLNLYSNWLIDSTDSILKCVDGENDMLSDSFYSAPANSPIGIDKEKWRTHHSADEKEFENFTKSLVFKLGRASTANLEEMVSDQMELCKLKNDQNSLLVGVEIVKGWVRSKTHEITINLLEEKIKEHHLDLPLTAESGVAIYFTTIKNSKFDINPDYIIDWKKYFETISDRGDHTLIDPTGWNKVLLPELFALENKVNSETTSRLIRARGFSRLSPWFAFGFAFSEVAGYKIEVNQHGLLWRTDASPNLDFNLLCENGNGENYASNTKTVAVGLSVTGSLNDSVRDYLKNNYPVDALLLLRPERDLNKDCLRDAGDVTALAIRAKEEIRNFVNRNKAEKLLLFYFGPLSGACFIGHQLNAVCKEIQIMENVLLSYIPSFSLK